MTRPILLIDIDGVLSLFGFDPGAPPDGTFMLVDGIPHYLSRAAAGRVCLLQDDFELIWCSGWEEKADEYLPGALELPAGLAHLTFGGPGSTPAGRHWKLDAIDAFAGPHRPLAWIDDGFDDSCHAWATARPAPTELVATDPAVGFTVEQAAHLASWARSLAG